MNDMVLNDKTISVGRGLCEFTLTGFVPKGSSSTVWKDMMTNAAPIAVELICQATKVQFGFARPFQRHSEPCYIAERAPDA
jgi:hypothetical protein